ncbi:hypothetical protein BHE74_00035845 [Ensete ventricosum]|nr:hypothetical protein GW17_00046234 [Ensete ventricosum]RWW57373.1 hypothetical protein BHE74_00035845 [Ensete ventricosum]
MTGAIELQPDDGPRSSLGIGPGSNDVVRPRREFSRRFTEGIGKLAGNTSGDRLKKTGRLITRMWEATGLARWEYRRCLGFRAADGGKPPGADGLPAGVAALSQVPCKRGRLRPSCLQGWPTMARAASKGDSLWLARKGRSPASMVATYVPDVRPPAGVATPAHEDHGPWVEVIGNDGR